MNAVAILLGIVAFSFLVLGGINLYLISLIRRLEREIDELQTPF
jgi:uncharacterized protein YoxC